LYDSHCVCVLYGEHCVFEHAVTLQSAVLCVCACVCVWVHVY
jgi:hypothetical protein